MPTDNTRSFLAANGVELVRELDPEGAARHYFRKTKGVDVPRESERARLEQVRDELGRATRATLLRLDGVLAGLDTDDPGTRREVLVTLFDGLHV